MTATELAQPTMQSTWYEQQGSANDALQFGEILIPEPKSGEVRIKVYASGVNPFGRVIPHQDGAGVIESVGEGVPSSRLGERVWIYEAQRGQAFGTAAQFVVVKSSHAIHLPDNTNFTEGACLGVPAMTAHRCVFADGAVKRQTILVTGGAGAVSYYAIQLAKWGGATVLTTISRPEQAEVAQTAGADHIINYKTEDVVKPKIVEK